MALPASSPALLSRRSPAVTSPALSDAVAFEQATVEFFTEAAEVLGLPKSVAMIYAVIFASPRPLSFAEVEDRLQLSKGSVSQGLRFLKQIGAIKAADAKRPKVAQASQPASEKRGLLEEASASALSFSSSAMNRDANASPHAATAAVAAYEPDMELRRLVARLLKEKIEPQLNGNDRRLAHLVATVPYADRNESRLVRARLKQLQSWHRKARKLVPFAKTLLAIG
jgi:predicted transcriptional regulator